MRKGFVVGCSLAAFALAVPFAVSTLSGCVGRSALETDPSLDAGPDGAAQPDAASPPIETSSKVDLLLVIDNSRSLDIASQVFVDTIPYLLDRLIHPACVNGLGVVLSTPADPNAPCPVGRRDFAPITDVHLAVISTSLGGHGADLCSPLSPSFDPQQNDAAHLLTRTESGGVVPTYQNQGFLSWDPRQAQSPPGESDAFALTAKFVEMVKGVGQRGCGFEAQLESIYRFLVDPNPYAQISQQNGEAVPSGTDATLLQQRADFLRPDSAVVVLLLTDENDCSIREGGPYFLAAQSTNENAQPYHLPRPRSECAKNPADPCCSSCSQGTPLGCPPSSADASCQLGELSAIEDPINLRCFDQKRRFGIDLLYPIDRYINAFTALTVADREGAIVPNPLFTGGRSPKLVIFGGILGVPWQDIANEPRGLANGFKPPAEIDWKFIIGDPANGVPPGDPLMIESIDPRASLAPPDSPLPTANPSNGHERLIPGRDGLQYACIFPSPSPKNCSGGQCECMGNNINTNPICQQPNGKYSSVQRAASALPSIRQLRLIQALGDQAAVGSVCAESTTGPDEATFGYKPSIDAVLRVLRRRLK